MPVKCPPPRAPPSSTAHILELNRPDPSNCRCVTLAKPRNAPLRTAPARSDVDLRHDCSINWCDHAERSMDPRGVGATVAPACAFMDTVAPCTLSAPVASEPGFPPWHVASDLRFRVADCINVSLGCEHHCAPGRRLPPDLPVRAVCRRARRCAGPAEIAVFLQPVHGATRARWPPLPSAALHRSRRCSCSPFA